MTTEPKPIRRRKSKPLAEKIRIAISRQIFILMKKGRAVVDKDGIPQLDKNDQQIYVQPSSADIAQAQQWLHRQPRGSEKSSIELALEQITQSKNRPTGLTD